MKKENTNVRHDATMAYYKQLSADWFQENQDEVIVLHHVNQDMKINDPERYAEWNVWDVVPMTSREHCKTHHLGKPQSRRELAKRRRNMEYTIANMKLHRPMLVKITWKDGKTRYARTLVDAAEVLGVSKQLVYYVLSPKFPYYKRACGCTLEWVSREDQDGEV